LGAVRLLFLGDGQIRKWEVAIPLLGLAMPGYTLYRNIIPWPAGSALWGPGLAVAVLALVIVGVLARPAAAREAGAKLMAQQGF
jgi:hypothetical protein